MEDTQQRDKPTANHSADIISSHEVSFESSYLPGSSFNFQITRSK